MRLYAISDLHIGHPENMAIVRAMRAHVTDWLILGGDVGEEKQDLQRVLDIVVPRFARVLWVPGNHELWTCRTNALRGEAKYLSLVEMCRSFGVLTPEDPYLRWPGDPRPTVIALMFLLYDYSFRPLSVARSEAVAWAARHNAVCADEELLHPDPYPSREAWCDARVALTEERLSEVPANVGTILVNHFPLRRSHVLLPRIPRFSPWCGTERTDTWHLRFRARAVVYGHLHMPRTHLDDGVPFEEVSLGYPRNRSRRLDISPLRQVWPRPADDSKHPT